MSSMRQTILSLALLLAIPSGAFAHGGGLNQCGCHFNRKTGDCHCHRNTGCGCSCQPSGCRSAAASDRPQLDARDLRHEHDAKCAGNEAPKEA